MIWSLLGTLCQKSCAVFIYKVIREMILNMFILFFRMNLESLFNRNNYMPSCHRELRDPFLRNNLNFLPSYFILKICQCVPFPLKVRKLSLKKFIIILPKVKSQEVIEPGLA